MMRRPTQTQLFPYTTLFRSANLDGAFYCTHAVLPQMIERRDGLIIYVSSIAGKRANPLGGAAYAAAKFGMGALGVCRSEEHTSELQSHVNLVCRLLLEKKNT